MEGFEGHLPSNNEKWTFWCHVKPNPAKVREKSCVWSVRSSRTPLDLLNFNLNYSFFTFYRIFGFSSFSLNFPVDSRKVEDAKCYWPSNGCLQRASTLGVRNACLQQVSNGDVWGIHHQFFRYPILPILPLSGINGGIPETHGKT